MANRAEKFRNFYYTSQFKRSQEELDFTVIESDSEAVFLFVKHDGYDDRGNIYISDAHGKSFSLSLKDTVRTAQGQVDFEEINSLEGVIIVNQELDGPLSEVKREKSLHQGNVIN